MVLEHSIEETVSLIRTTAAYRSLLEPLTEQFDQLIEEF